MVIEIQGRNSRTACRRQPNHTNTTPREVCIPLIRTWIEKGNQMMRRGIFSLAAIAFGEIAAWTGQREVIEVFPAAADSRDDVLDVKSGALDRLVHLAVFATTVRADNDRFDRLRSSH